MIHAGHLVPTYTKLFFLNDSWSLPQAQKYWEATLIIKVYLYLLIDNLSGANPDVKKRLPMLKVYFFESKC